MPRLSKNQAKIAFWFCTLFCLYSPFVFSQQVDTAWVRRFNGPGNGDDQAAAIAVDSGGNVYVTGSSFDSTTGYDYCTIKYLSNGDTAWVRRYNGPASKNDTPITLGLDNEGNVLVTGRSVIVYNQISTYNEGFATIKYDPDGNVLWIRTAYFATQYSTGGAYALAIDKQNNVYVTGELFDVLGFLFWVTIKYDPNGNGGWSANENNPNPSLPYGIAVDNEENVFVIHADSTIKYDSSGNRAWARNFPGVLRSTALDNGGNVYVVGDSGYYNFALIKYSPAGDSLWVRRSSAVPEWFNYGASLIETDKDNNVYVGGTYWFFPDDVDWTTIKYDSSGNLVWFRGYNGIDFGLPREPKAMVLDSAGNVFITGYDAWYAATLKYDAQGNLIWEKKCGDDSQWAKLDAIAVDQKGSVYVTGFTQSNFLTIKYSPLPSVKGDLNLDGILDLNDIVFALNFAFMGIAPPAAPSGCDINCDGAVTAADAVILLQMVFLSAPAPC